MKREDVKGRAVQNGSEWVIEWECPENCWADDHPVSIDFKIYGEVNGGDELLSGYIKWDGCSNWSGCGGFFHLCGPESLKTLYDAMAMCYTIAGKYMPEAIE